MEWERGRVVKSIAGRDKGTFLLVLSVVEGRVLVTDGRDRPLERPKQKNAKHLGQTNTVLPDRSMATNREIRRALALVEVGAGT